uniref:Rho guanine nucleotide exchange factor 7 n=1 Tax=Syphacia muris TaxID=451379 RepID=A0A0N5AKL6_9BILA
MVHSDSDDQVSKADDNDQKFCPAYAKANFPFEGRNNDELSFSKGDIIAVTQQIDGGWWEGTLGPSTGWFPSAYVSLLSDTGTFFKIFDLSLNYLYAFIFELKYVDGLCKVKHCLERAEHLAKNIGLPDHPDESLDRLSGSNESSLQTYRKQIIEDFLESERTYVKEMLEFYNNLLSKLNYEEQIADQPVACLAGNLKRLIFYQQEILNSIEDAVSKDSSNAKIGGLLLAAASSIRELLREYCQNHPSAIDFVLKNREIYTKATGGFGSNINQLISCLSKPFRHLEKYAATLNEIERSMSGTNADKGNTQRAVAVFRDIANLCMSVRKQKEMQLELKNSGLIEGLSSSEIEALGDIIYMGSVTLGDEETLVEEHLPVDRCLVLFSTALIVLEITQTLNKYILKEKIDTEGMKVKRIEPKLSLLIVSGDHSFDTLMSVSFTEELQRWIEAFCSCANVNVCGSCTISTAAVSEKHDISEVRSVSELSPPRKPEILQMPIPSKAEKSKNIPGFRIDHNLEMILPDSGQEKADQSKEETKQKNKMRLYSGYALRPYPVVRGNWAVDYSRKISIKLRKSASQMDQEDAYLLRIVEGYCDIKKHDKASCSGSLGYMGNQPPQLIVAEDEKILMEELIGDEVVVQEK